MTEANFIRVPVALLDACKPSDVMSEAEALADLCGRFWYGEQPSRTGLEKGETRATHGQLADAWGWTRHRVRSFLRKLENTGEISTLGEGRCTTIRLTQTWRNLDATMTQPERKRTKEKRGVTGRRDATMTQTRRNHDATLTRNQERDRESRDREEQIDPVATLQDLAPADASAVPSGEVDTGDDVEPTRREPNLTTKAGRERAFPAVGNLPKGANGRHVWPEPFATFLAAYPGKAARKPGPGTYSAWRKLVIDGVSVDELLAAVRAYAKTEAVRKGMIRRAHGPSGWLLSGDWQGVAEDATPVESSSRPADFGGLFDATDDEAWERRKAEHAEREAQRAAQRVAADADYFDC